MANHPSQMARKAINVAEDERLLSLIVGPALILIGLRPRGWLGVLLALVGAELVYRGATGHCHVYEALDIDRSPGARSRNGRGVDIVHEASQESFPASDPPSWTVSRS